jgi:hypothetical protein
MFGLEESLLERLTRRPLYLPDRQRFLSHGGFDPFLVTKLVRNYRYRYRRSVKCNLRYSLPRVVGLKFFPGSYVLLRNFNGLPAMSILIKLMRCLLHQKAKKILVKISFQNVFYS